MTQPPPAPTPDPVEAFYLRGMRSFVMACVTIVWSVYMLWGITHNDPPPYQLWSVPPGAYVLLQGGQAVRAWMGDRK